jgi:hypothetical protein
MLGRQKIEGVLGKSRKTGFYRIGVSSSASELKDMFQAIAGPFACLKDAYK